MKLVLTGGGTGGHIYPALEVGRLCAEQGAELLYLGSLRGQEGRICGQRGIAFEGFPSQPLYSIKTPRGWVALIKLLRASVMAKAALRRLKPDVVFSTGGYSAAPVMRGARSLGIPYVIHEQNSVPGRSNRMFAVGAHKVAVTFNRSLTEFPGARVVRTGMPVRRELRLAAQALRPQATGHKPNILVIGGSQGSQFLNEHVPPAAKLMDAGVEWTHATGPSHFQTVQARAKELGLGENYHIHGFLEAAQLTEEYGKTTVAVARSGGTLAEFAVFGIPSVLVPLPSAAGDHQAHNAKEFSEMGAATIQPEAELTDASLAAAIQEWLERPEKRDRAAEALRGWDVPDATEQIAKLIQEAAGRG